MPRRLRSYLPGMPFHITARLNNREKWLHTDQSRDVAADIIAEGVRKNDALLIAFSIMSNHLHLVVRQGRAELAQLMQPMLRRIALHLRRTLGRTGHIFERPFFDSPCAEPDYLRTMIVYTHLNPLRAGLCDRSLDYRWTSHAHYCGYGAYRDMPVTPCLEAFAEQDVHGEDDWRRSYLRFVDAAIDSDDSCKDRGACPQTPIALAGDRYWTREFTRCHDALTDAAIQSRADLRDIARAVVAQFAPDTTLEQLCAVRSGRPFPGLRRTVIQRATLAGHRRVDIARLLGVSDSYVSKIASMVENRPPTEYSPRRRRRPAQ